jgi:transcriptional regulator with PAS, ATPase and Fis domain
MSTQVKLLRLLQQREYEPVGGTEPVKADIRVVAATNRNLKKLVAQGKFRDDLYFRLAVVKIELPPLSERREDIPYLVDHFITKFNSRLGKKIVSVSPSVMSVLMRYDFPGNIRELENIIEYGFVVCRGNVIQKKHLPQELLKSEVSDSKDDSGLSSPVTQSIDTETQIRLALKESHGRLSQAAEKLNIHRTTLWRRLRRYKIDPQEYKANKHKS